MNLNGRKVIVKDGNVEKALRKLKKKVSESGMLLELQEREQYIKPCVRKKLARKTAEKRWQKHLSQQNLPKPRY